MDIFCKRGVFPKSLQIEFLLNSFHSFEKSEDSIIIIASSGISVHTSVWLGKYHLSYRKYPAKQVSNTKIMTIMIFFIRK